jgi:hypothetical protein
MARRKTIPTHEEQLYALEAHLAGTLKPVQPPKHIIQRLRDRIRFPGREEIALRLRDWHALLLVFGGVMSGMVLVITVARVMFHLFGRRNAL